MAASSLRAPRRAALGALAAAGALTLARMKAAPGWKTYEVTSGHDVMVDHPDRLAEILLEAA